MSGYGQDLEQVMAVLARTPVLLVATDFDGTLAPIVTNSWEAAAPPEALAALQALGDTPDTHVAVLTGRSLAALAALGPLPSSALRVGSHGAEWGDGLLVPLTSEQASVLARARAIAVDVVHGAPGAVLEDKPAGFAVHVRAMSDRALAEAVPQRLRDGLAGLPGLSVLPGKQVIEATVVHSSKGSALISLRDGLGATAVFYAGDDVTDETAFTVLSSRDVGVKVGDGDTLAEFRVPDPAAVTRLLAELAIARAAVLRPA